MVLVVGVVDEVDLLKFALLGGIESSLLFLEGVLEGSSLGSDCGIKRYLVGLKSLFECSSALLKHSEESNFQVGNGSAKIISCLFECSVFSELMIGNKNIHLSGSLFKEGLKFIFLQLNLSVKSWLFVVVSIVSFLLQLVDPVLEFLAKLIGSLSEFNNSSAYFCFCIRLSLSE